jgi:uncharacterized membrane protein
MTASPTDDTPPTGAPNTPSPRVARMRSLALAGLLGLIGLGLVWELLVAPIGRGTLALKVLPLVLCLPGVWRHRLYTYRWLSLLVWLYFMEGLTRALTERGASQMVAVLYTGCTLLLFAAVAIYVRARLNVVPPAAGPRASGA